MKTITVLLTICLATTLAHAWAIQETEPGVATAPLATTSVATSAPIAGADGKEKLIATVTGIEGNVQVNVSGNEGDWQKATVGMEVSENAEFRTGPRSAVR